MNAAGEKRTGVLISLSAALDGARVHAENGGHRGRHGQATLEHWEAYSPRAWRRPPAAHWALEQFGWGQLSPPRFYLVGDDADFSVWEDLLERVLGDVFPLHDWEYAPLWTQEVGAGWTDWV